MTNIRGLNGRGADNATKAFAGVWAGGILCGLRRSGSLFNVI